MRPARKSPATRNAKAGGGRKGALRAAKRGRKAAILVGSCVSLIVLVGPALGDEMIYNPRTTYGEVGILEMPSARTAPDGQLALTVGLLDGMEHFNASFQLVPWAEVSFRYSRIPNLIIHGIAEYDRSFGLKIRLSNETRYFPQIALGARDILGTGLYSGEYLVASKRIDDFDVTLGMGWGRFAQRSTFTNPFALIFPSFKNRVSDSGLGGTVSFGQFFHGPKVGLFGGVIWRSPIPDLDVLVEYSSDLYTREGTVAMFKVRSPLDVGLSYHLFNFATLSAGWFYGTGYGGTLTFDTNPTNPLTPQKLGPDIPAPVIRPVKQQVDALTQLLDRAHPDVATVAGAPWVKLPASPPSADSMAVASTLMSVGKDVHDVEVEGKILMVDARLGSTADRQCARYAQIVASVNPHLQTVALSDADDRSGRVRFCAIPHTAQQIADTSDPTSVDAVPADSAPADAASAPVDEETVTKRIRDDVAAQSLVIEALAVDPQMAWVYFTNRKYESQAEAAGRIARVLMADAPPSVEIFHIVAVTDGIDLRDFQVARSALERATTMSGTTRELGDAVTVQQAPLSNPVFDRAMEDSYPRFHWSIGPGVREGFFDPSQPLQIQILAAANANLDITPKISLEGRVEANIYDNYDLTVPSNSQLPHVRSDLNLYLQHGINGIANLDALYRTRLSRDVYFEAKVGYLEDMFAGGGVQALWRPDGGRFAFGADVYQVWQRNFDRLFGVQNYHILTGHASVYYQSPWYGLNFAVHAGRYLAGDYGATFELTRRFETGVEVGAFATFTNVPFAKFGEGSFDKGLIIHIPLEWALPFYSTSAYDLHLRSIVRDGGQRLDDDDSLYADTRANSYGEIIGHLDEISAP